MDKNTSGGSDFLLASAQQQNQCAFESRRRLPQLNVEIQTTYENLGALLFLLDRFASCFWGCHGKKHVIEFLVGRTVSCARAALRLIEFGHYDEAMALIRNIMEVGNLMWLFFVEPDHIRGWLDAPEDERRKRYSAVLVRKSLEGLGAGVPHEQTQYALASGTGVHPSPKGPQSHNLHEVPTVGGIYQEKGFVSCLVKLAWATASVGGPAAKLAELDSGRAQETVDAATRLVEELPDVEDYIEVTGSSEEIKARAQWTDENVRGKEWSDG